MASKERLESFILGTGWVEGSYEGFNLRWLLLTGEEYAWGRDHTVRGTQGIGGPGPGTLRSQQSHRIQQEGGASGIAPSPSTRRRGTNPYASQQTQDHGGPHHRDFWRTYLTVVGQTPSPSNIEENDLRGTLVRMPLSELNIDVKMYRSMPL